MRAFEMKKIRRFSHVSRILAMREVNDRGETVEQGNER